MIGTIGANHYFLGGGFLPQIKFTKMHGIGNDYVYINCFEQQINNPNELSIKMSPRRFSVGADGVILICPSDVADAKMRMFNLDGSEGKMCGNGIRCVGKFVYDNNIAHKDVITVETLSGIKTLYITDNGGFADTITVDMGKAEFSPSQIPAIADCNTIIDTAIKVDGNDYNRRGDIIGLTEDGKLKLMNAATGDEAIEAGIKYGLEFGPFLIVNGKSMEIVGMPYGVANKCIIAQRKDGVIMFLITEGETYIDGASLKDVVETLEKYGAYNAANLDGGQSTSLVINNQLVNTPNYLAKKQGGRYVVTGFGLIP